MAEQKKVVTEEVKAEETQQEQQAPVVDQAPEGAPQVNQEQNAPVKEPWYKKAGNAIVAGAKKVGNTVKKAAPYVAGVTLIAGAAYAKGALDTMKANLNDQEPTPEQIPEKKEEEVDEIKVTEIPAEESQEVPEETQETTSEE